MTLLADIRTQDQLILKLAELGYKRAEDHIEEDADWDSPNSWSFAGNTFPCKINEVCIWINPKWEDVNCWTTFVFIRDDDPERRITRWSFCKYGGFEEIYLVIDEATQEILELENIDEYLEERIKIEKKKGGVGL